MLAGLYASRALVGLGEGVAPSGATDMVARVITKNERARAISFIFSGLHVGSLLGLLVAPPLIENFGWETVFYIFGMAGEPAARCCSRCITRPALPGLVCFMHHRATMVVCTLKVNKSVAWLTLQAWRGSCGSSLSWQASRNETQKWRAH